MLVNNAGVQPTQRCPRMTAAVASVEARHSAPEHAHYSAFEAAIVMHVRSAALEYGPRGIRVNTAPPG